MLKSKYFIIGGHGYVGGALSLAIQDDARRMVTASSVYEGFLRLRLEVPEDYANLPISVGDIVFLTAAISAPDICAREHDRAWTVNVSGTSAFIENVIGRGGRIIFFSSDTVYGEREDDFNESAACNPAGEYAVMKHEVEQRFAGNSSFKAIRLSYVFSRDDKFTKYLVGSAQRAEEAELFHPFYRAIIHRGDVVDGALALARRWDEFPQQVINFGGPDVVSRIDFAECLKHTALPNLQYRVTEPGDEFFKNRPRVISMSSGILPNLLDRPSRTLSQAAQIEFSANCN